MVTACCGRFFVPVKATRPQESARIFPGGRLQNCQQPARFDLLSAAEKLTTSSTLFIFQNFNRNVCFSSVFFFILFFLDGIFGFVFFPNGSCWHEVLKNPTNLHFVFFNYIAKPILFFLKTLLLFWTMELVISLVVLCGGYTVNSREVGYYGSSELFAVL